MTTNNADYHRDLEDIRDRLDWAAAGIEALETNGELDNIKERLDTIEDRLDTIDARFVDGLTKLANNNVKLADNLQKLCEARTTHWLIRACRMSSQK